jgi:hypothetical protein
MIEAYVNNRSIIFLGPVATKIDFCSYDTVFIPGNMIKIFDFSCVNNLIIVVNWWFSVHRFWMLTWYVKTHPNVKFILCTLFRTKHWFEYKRSFLNNITMNMNHPPIQSNPLLLTFFAYTIIHFNFRKLHITGINFYETESIKGYKQLPLSKNHNISENKQALKNYICENIRISIDYKLC